MNLDSKKLPHSPDLNAIEIIWAILKCNVSARNPINLNELMRFTKGYELINLSYKNSN